MSVRPVERAVDAPATDVEAFVVVEGATRRFRRGPETVNAVDGVSFSIVPGELIVLIGPSGSGKSTLLDLVLGWDTPDAGTVCGLPPRPNWQQVAVVPQRLGLLDHLTVRENVEIAQRVTGSEDPTRLADVIERLGLTALIDRFPTEVSLGEQQRTAVARAIVTAPRFLVLDEPTSHQDERSTERITAAIVDEVARGAAALVATHDAALMSIATRTLAMSDGRLTD